MKRLLKVMLALITYLTLLLSTWATSPQDVGKGNVFINEYQIDEALFLLKIKTVYPSGPPIYYSFDLTTKRLTKSTPQEYLLNKVLSSPSQKWEVVAQEDGKIIVNNTGLKIYTLGKNVINYSWSPKGDQIVYIDHDKMNCEIGPYCPGTIWIYNLISHNKLKLTITGYDVAWPSFDHNIYIDVNPRWDNKSKIIRYNPSSGKVESTPYQGLIFSPTGKYYYRNHFEESPLHVYQREPHDELTKINHDLENRASLGGWALWLADNHSILLSGKMGPTKKFIVYDLDNGKISKTIEGAFLGLDRSKRYGVFMKGIDKFEVVDLLSSDQNSK